MASSYTAFAPTLPAGTQTGTLFATSANANDVALWYAIASGQLPSYVMSQTIGTGTAEQPQYWLWTDGAYIVRATNTWGTSSGANGNLTQIIWDVSQDTGGTYANVCTQTFTYDASGNLTATSGAGGFASFLGYLIGKVKTLLTNFNTHTALLVASGPHGVGTIASQAATAVAITGGNIDGTVIGATTRALATFLQARGIRILPTFGTTTTLDWSLGDSFTFTATGSGAATLAFANVPAAGITGWITLNLTNGGLRTWTWPTGTKWVGGAAPALSSAGRDRLNFFTEDGGATIDGFVGKGMA